MKNHIEKYYRPYQLKLPIEISKIIDVEATVLSFREVVDHIELSKYFAEEGVDTEYVYIDGAKEILR